MLVLLVDDSDLMRRSVTRTLKSMGHEVAQAVDGIQGLELFLSMKKFDLVLSDKEMSGMDDGKQFYITIKPALQNCGFVLMSGTLNEADRAFAKREGIPLLSKPFTKAELQIAIDIACNMT